ncbi:hypothetical protein U3516DRAFT_737545 [Neocallimastix sp. 'constans']
MNEEVYDYLMELNRLTRVIGCTEEQRKGIALKDLTRCLIRCDIDQKRYYDEKQEKEIVAKITDTEYRIFVNEWEKEENGRKENGKLKHKRFPPYKEKSKEDTQGKGKIHLNDNHTSNKGNFRRPSRIFSSYNNPLPTTMLCDASNFAISKMHRLIQCNDSRILQSHLIRLAITDAFRLVITGDCECNVNYISSYAIFACSYSCIVNCISICFGRLSNSIQVLYFFETFYIFSFAGLVRTLRLRIV